MGKRWGVDGVGGEGVGEGMVVVWVNTFVGAVSQLKGGREEHKRREKKRGEYQGVKAHLKYISEGIGFDLQRHEILPQMDLRAWAGGCGPDSGG